MGICRKCGAPVEDGEELCEKCRLEIPQERESQESYLDSLLHTVENTPSDTERRLPKKNREKTENGIEQEGLSVMEEPLEASADMPDWTELDLEGDLDSWEGQDDLDGFGDLEEEAELEDILASQPQLEEEIDQEINSITDLGEQLEKEIELPDDSEPEPVLKEDKIDNVVEDFLEDLDREGGDPEQKPENGLREEIKEAVDEGDKMEEREDENEEEDDIMSLLNMIGGDDDEEEPLPAEPRESIPPETAEEPPAAEPEEEAADDGLDDILSLLGESEPDDFQPEPGENRAGIPDEEPGEDVFSLDDFMSDSSDEAADGLEKEEAVSDIGDILSDSLSAVSSEQDENEDFKKLEKMISADAKSKKEKRGMKFLFSKLFGNIHDEKAEKAKEKEEEKEKERQAKKEAKKNAQGKKADTAEEEGGQEGEEKAGNEKKAKKEKKEKKAKKEKKPKEEQVKELAEEAVEEEADEGRINRVGATIIFIFAAAFTIFTILGTNSFQYNLSIKNAGDYFDVKKYNEAYGEVRGIEIKKKDEELFNKIITVMYVNKQINSYNNYFNMKKYPEALDSLLKGLKRYDTYISEAEQLGIVKDYDYLRERIKKELAEVFGISEEEGYAIINTSSRELYGKRVQEAAVLQ